MAVTNPHTTVSIMSSAPRKERTATAVAILPGSMLTVDSAQKVLAHDLGGGPGGALFAIENDSRGQEVTDTYLAGDQVQYRAFQKGDEVLCRIKDGESIVAGDWLVSNGDGTMKEATATSAGGYPNEHIILQALEVCDMSSSAGGDDDGYCWAEVV